jgi:hypothetical protein
MIYPVSPSGTNPISIRLWFTYDSPYPYPLGQSVELSAAGQNGSSFVLQSSANLTDWVSLTTNQINGSIFTVYDYSSAEGRFFRLVPQ